MRNFDTWNSKWQLDSRPSAAFAPRRWSSTGVIPALSELQQCARALHNQPHQKGKTLTVLGALIADFPWGVLLVSDSESREEIPEWSSVDDQVTSANSALVVRVMHGDEGSVSVRVLDRLADSAKTCVFRGGLAIGSGRLRVSDALGGESVSVDVSPGVLDVAVYADADREATSIDVIVGQAARLG